MSLSNSTKISSPTNKSIPSNINKSNITFTSTIELCNKYKSLVFNSKLPHSKNELCSLQTNLGNLLGIKSFQIDPSLAETILKLVI